MRRTITAAVASLAAVLVLGACSSTPSGTVLGQGCRDGIQSVPGGETFYFDGTGGSVFNVLTSVVQASEYTVTAPGGASIVPSNSIVGSGLGKFNLPNTGRYKVHIAAPSPLVPFRLCFSVDEDRGAIGLGTTTVSGLEGQSLTYHYTGTAGEHLSVLPAWTGVAVYDPDGNALPPGPSFTLPVDGEYRLVFPLVGGGGFAAELADD